MTPPELPPVLPGFSDPVMGPLTVHTDNLRTSLDIATEVSGEWCIGGTGGYHGRAYSLRLGSPIALANGITTPANGLAGPELRFQNVSCSQCGRDFGPGDHGISHCSDHTKETEDAEQRAFEDWLARECPSGDVESVQRQWLASSDYADLEAPEQAANPDKAHEYHGGYMSPERAQQLESDLAAARAEINEWRRSEKSLSDAYLRLRVRLDAFDTSHNPTAEGVWQHTEEVLKSKLDALCQADAEIQRLRAALEPFAKFACDEPHVGEPMCHNCIAKAALAPASSGKGEG